MTTQNQLYLCFEKNIKNICFSNSRSVEQSFYKHSVLVMKRHLWSLQLSLSYCVPVFAPLKHNYSILFYPLFHHPLCFQVVLQNLSILYFSLLVKPSLTSALNYSSVFMDLSDKNLLVLFHFILFCLNLDFSSQQQTILFHLSKLMLFSC